MRNKLALIVAMGLVAAPIAAQAVPIQLTVQGMLAKDASPSIFGITDGQVPIQFSLGFDSDDAQTILAGTLIESNSNASFASDIHVLRSSNLTSFVATVGSASFATQNLLTRDLGTTGLFYEILLVGQLTENGISRAEFWVEDGAVGSMQVGQLNCFITCNVGTQGSAVDFVAGSTGEITELATFTQVQEVVEVSEPGTLALLGLGLAGLGVMRRKRAA